MRWAARCGYRWIRMPLGLLDDLVLVRACGADAPVRLVFDRALIECDRLAARLLDDPACAARAADLCARSDALRYALARSPRRLQQQSDMWLARHRALFRERQLRSWSPGPQ